MSLHREINSWHKDIPRRARGCLRGYWRYCLASGWSLPSGFRSQVESELNSHGDFEASSSLEPPSWSQDQYVSIPSRFAGNFVVRFGGFEVWLVRQGLSWAVVPDPGVFLKLNIFHISCLRACLDFVVPPYLSHWSRQRARKKEWMNETEEEQKGGYVYVLGLGREAIPDLNSLFGWTQANEPVEPCSAMSQRTVSV